MSPLLHGFLIVMSGVLALTGGYLVGVSLHILRSRDPFAPTESVWVALPFGLIAVGSGAAMLYVGTR